MSKVVIIRKNQMYWFTGIGILIGLLVIALSWNSIAPAGGAATEERVIHMVTGEYKAVTPEGKQIEAYRWDPGTVPVRKGERVRLIISGVNGASHPFYIEGLNIQGEVRKGEETHVQFTADKEGIYRIVCTTHPDLHNNGPMVGYIVVY